MPGDPEEQPQPSTQAGPTWLPAADPRMIRVRRGDGQEFDLPADTAVQLGAPLELARRGQSPATGANVPAVAAITGATTPAAPPAQEPDLASFIEGLASQPAPSAPPASATPPAARVAPELAPDVAGLLTPEGQRQLGVQPAPAPSPGHTGAAPAAVAPGNFRRVEDATARAMGSTPAPAPRPGETFVTVQPGAAAPGVAPAAATPAQAPRSLRQRAAAPAPELTEEQRNASLVDELTRRPEGAPPIVPQDMRTMTPLEQEQQRIEEGRRIAQEQAHSEAVAEAERGDILRRAAEQQAELERQRQAAEAAATARYEAAVAEARNARVDPARFYRDRGAAGTIGVAIATALGGLGAALTGGPNRALETIERAIDRDIAAQEANQRNAQAGVANARTFLDITRTQFSDRGAAQDAARALAWDQVARRAGAMAATLRDEGARLRAQELQAEAEQRAQASRVAAIQAAQDRELANARAAAEIRRLNAQAARDERRAGGGGGGGGGRVAALPPAGVIGTADDPLVREAVALGIPESIAMEQAADARGGRSSGRTRLQERVTREATSRGRSAAAASIPGWERTEDAPLLTQPQIGAARQIANADLEFQAAVRRLERVGANIGVGERLAGRFGFGSEAYQEFQHALDVVRTQFRNINQLGNSLGATEMVEHQFPDLNSNTTVDAILRNVRAAQRVKHDYVTALMRNNGYVPGGGGHGEGGAPRAPLPSGVRPRGGVLTDDGDGPDAESDSEDAGED